MIFSFSTSKLIRKKFKLKGNSRLVSLLYGIYINQREGKKGCGFGWVEKWEGSGGVGGGKTIIKYIL